MQFDHADIGGSHASLLIGKAGCTGSDFGIENVVIGVLTHARDNDRAQYLDSLGLRPRLCSEHQGGGAIHLRRAALQQRQGIGDHP
ncbi:hypothetical protein D3C76_625270 [compost metagenome]